MKDICRAVVLLFLLVSVASAEAPSATNKVSPWLDEVLTKLNFEVRGTTPFEKQESLLEHFRKRPKSTVASIYNPGSANRSPTSSLRKLAEMALEHKFIGQPSYGYYFRGKDEIDWDSNPVSDIEWIVQFHRMSAHPALAAMYRVNQDERYAREWVFEVDSWINHMHNLAKPYNHKGWRSLDTAIRMMRWSLVFDDFVRSPSLDSATLASFLYSIHIHMERTGDICEKARRSDRILGNWDIHHAEALLVAGAAFPELKDSTKFLNQAAECLANFQQRVLLPDGVINEYIPSYHSPYPGNFCRLLRFVKELNLPITIPDNYNTLLEKSIDAVTIWSHPDATSPVFGDAWLGAPGTNRRWIAPFLSMFDRPDWRWFASNGKEGTHPESRMRELPCAGYYTMRSDWTNQALFVVLKNSNLGTIKRRGHNQADNMTFELSAYGQRLMTDSGCYNYSGEPQWRAWFRSPVAHQLVSLDDHPIHSFGKKVLDSSSDLLDVLVVENEPTKGLTHRRTLMLLAKKCFVIVDRLTGPAEGELRQHFQFLHGPHELDKSRLVARTRWDNTQKVGLYLQTASSSGITMEAEEGWISTKYMRKEERPAFAFVQKKGKNECRYFATLLFPIPKKSSEPDIKFDWNEGTGLVSITFDGKERYEIKVDPETSQCRLIEKEKQ